MSDSNLIKKQRNINLITQAEKEAREIIEKCKKHQKKIALAESCTAGFISGFLADIDGASSVLWGSFVCYTKEAKMKMLDLNGNELDKYGLVSKETASSMALGALEKSGAGLAASVTGLAGPNGDGSDTPVGTVWIAAASPEGVEPVKFFFEGQRNDVRLKAVIAAMEMIHKTVDKLIENR